jgi:hypothetical protein
MRSILVVPSDTFHQLGGAWVASTPYLVGIIRRKICVEIPVRSGAEPSGGENVFFFFLSSSFRLPI